VKWFFALNDGGRGYPDYALMAQVAVVSARRHTALEPVFIFDGAANALTDWMQGQGVRVIHHRSSLHPLLVDNVRRSGNRAALDIGAGAFLRLDIPELCAQHGIDDEYALYTDCDVMFCREVADELLGSRPRLFAGAPQSQRDSAADLNSGVLWMNLPALRAEQPAFSAYVHQAIDRLCAGSYDQVALREYYGRERCGTEAWEPLPLTLNWKPYWGANPDAAIVHFHGPKPTSRTSLARGLSPAGHRVLVRGDYYAWCRAWDEYATGLQPPPPAVPPASTGLEFAEPAPETFDGAAYLAAYPDVVRALDQGRYGSAWEHYFAAGLWEGRPGVAATVEAALRRRFAALGAADPAPRAPPPGWALALHLRDVLARYPLPAGDQAVLGHADLAAALGALQGVPVAVLDQPDQLLAAGDSQAALGIWVIPRGLPADAALAGALATLARSIRPDGYLLLVLRNGDPAEVPAAALRDAWRAHLQLVVTVRRPGGERLDLFLLRPRPANSATMRARPAPAAP
jgi:hypothetical protein